MHPRGSEVMEGARQRLIKLGFESSIVNEALCRAAALGEENASVEKLVDWFLENNPNVAGGKEKARDADGPRPREAATGLDRVFERERRRVDEFADLVTDGLQSVKAFTVLAGEIENYTRSMIDRRRLNRETEDDIMEEMLHKSHVAGVSVESPSLPRSGPLPEGMDPCSRAHRVGKVLTPYTRASHGVLSLSEAYRVYNRSRLRDIATPEEFVQACALFETAGVQMRLERGAIFSSDGDADTILKQVVAFVSKSEKGASRVDVSSQMGLPVGVTTLYLNRAEARALVARDDTARGVYYHVNKFMTFDVVR